MLTGKYSFTKKALQLPTLHPRLHHPHCTSLLPHWYVAVVHLISLCPSQHVYTCRLCCYCDAVFICLITACSLNGLHCLLQTPEKSAGATVPLVHLFTCSGIWRSETALQCTRDLSMILGKNLSLWVGHQTCDS